jgi:hypothetical protein
MPATRCQCAVTPVMSKYQQKISYLDFLIHHPITDTRMIECVQSTWDSPGIAPSALRVGVHTVSGTGGHHYNARLRAGRYSQWRITNIVF